MYTELDEKLTEEQRLLKETAHEFAKEVLRPASVAIDEMTKEEIIKRGSVYWEVKKKARQLGYHLMGIPKVLGGFEASPLEFHIVMEEFGWGSPGLGLSIITDAFPAIAVLMYQPQNKKLINEIVLAFIKDSDEKIVSCWAATEPDHGSDVGFCHTRRFPDPRLAYSTKAVLQGDQWVINGQKSGWTSNGPVATQALTYLTILDSKGIAGGGIVIVPLDLPGVKRGKTAEMMGSCDFPQCEIFFEDVRVPKDYMVIGPDLYEDAFDPFVNMTMATVATVYTGLARAAFEEAFEYSKRRIQGGCVLADHQIIKLKLFDMFTKVEAARALSRAAVEYCLRPRDPVPLEYSSAAKVFCTQAAFEVAHEAIMIHGAYGLSKEALTNRLFRDARVSLIEDGTSEAAGLRAAYKIVESYRP